MFPGLIFVGACETGSLLKTAVPQGIVRIAILKEVDEVIVKMRGRYRIIDPSTGRILDEGRRLRARKVVPSRQGIQIGIKKYLVGQVRLIPSKDVGIQAGRQDKKYRGTIDIIRNKEGRLLVVNRLGLEDYIRGVLYHEVSHRWPMAALKAQAVAARTYVIYQMRVNVGEAYDVTSDIYSQVYGGRSAERYRTNLAVKRTRGQIMRFKGEVLPAYYHATCGGFTEDVREIWEHDDLSPLKGIRCGFCTRSPHYRWKRNLRLQDIQEALNVRGHRLGAIKEIHVAGRNKSGRIKDLRIRTRGGKSLVISGKDFREIVGPSKIKSNDYRIVMRGYYLDLMGKGWGHGVGMCQWGAYGMARQRHTYDAILRYYYPGSEIGGLK